MRPGYNYQFYQSRFREKQRQLDTMYSDVDVIPFVGIGGFDSDMTHFTAVGYDQLAHNLFRRLRQDFYSITDSVGMRPPSIRKAFYTTSANTSIGMTFKYSNPNSIPSDSLSNNIKNSFYLDNVRMSTATSLTLSTNKDTMYLNLPSSSSASYIQYLPAISLTSDTSLGQVYNGPFIRNSKGVAMLTFDSIRIEASTIPDTSNWVTETKDYLTRLYAAGSFCMDVSRKWLLDSTIVKLKNSGIWDRMDAIYFLANCDTLTAHRNLKSSSYTIERRKTGANHLTFTTDRGYYNSASDSGYLLPGITPSTLSNFSRDSGTVIAYNHKEYTVANNSSLTSTMFGTTDSTGTFSWLSGMPFCGMNNSSVRRAVCYFNSSSSGGFNQPVVTVSDGLFQWTRRSASVLRTYQNGSSIDSSTVNSTNSLNRPLWIFGMNATAYGIAAPQYIYKGGMTFFAIGNKLNTAQASDLFTNIVEPWMLRVGASYTTN